MFELEILFANVAVPAAIVLIACLLVLHKTTIHFVNLALSISSGLAIWVAFAVRNGFAWWPEDAWQKVPVAAMLVSVVAIIVDGLHSGPRHTKATPPANEEALAKNSVSRRFISELIQCATIAFAVAIAAWLSYPSGEAWSSIQPQRLQWFSVMILAASLAWWGIRGCKSSVASAVGFATIPLLIASAFLTALSMMKVTEPLIAIATVLGLCSFIDLRLAGRRSLPVMIAPALFAMSGFIAHANFQSYLNLPRTLYFLAMFSPAIVALVARMAQPKSTRFAIVSTILIALVLAVTIGVWAFMEGDAGHTDDW